MSSNVEKIPPAGLSQVEFLFASWIKGAAQVHQTQLLDEHKKDCLDELTTDVNRLQAKQDWQTRLFYVVIGLLVWLLIKLW